MNTNLMKRALPLTVTTTILAVALITGAQAATTPVKLVLASHIGSEVNKTTKGKICTVASHDVCQLGSESTEPGGFANPNAIAVQTDPRSPHFGDVYVADESNQRVQELTPNGEFVLMFGSEVNETTEGDICTAEEIKTSGVKCKTGVQGTTPGAFNSPTSVAVDPSTGEVYVQDLGNFRVQAFTEAGEFVFMVGKGVNQTLKDATEPEERNLCTAASHDLCGAGASAPLKSKEEGAFSFEYVTGHNDILAVGGGVLYVGDEQRVEKFKSKEGSLAGEIPLPPGGPIRSLAVNESGDVYFADEGGNVVLELNPSGQPLMELSIAPREPKALYLEVGVLALDDAGHLAVTVLEDDRTQTPLWFGLLYGASTGRPVTEFSGWGPSGMAFGASGELYAAAFPTTTYGSRDEVLEYKPLPVGELLTGAATCQAGAERETDATFDCGLGGEVDAWGVKETTVSFQWGGTASLGEATAPPSSIVNVKGAGEEEPLVKVSAPLVGLLPNATYYYEPVGYDENVKPPEKALSGDRVSFTTPAVPPRIVGEPSASFVGSSSAVLFGELNPENANTEYFFEYGACPTLAQCGETQITKSAGAQSSAYGTIGTALQLKGLQPASVYSYRLFAQSENTAKTGKLKVTGPEGTFTTALAPVPQASTGAPSAVTSTSAVVSGAATPDGQAATYAFELGVYGGASTRYGIVFSGSAGASVGSVGESVALSGLQPGTTYAYRIVVKSGYGAATGEAVLFTTTGLPAVLVSPSPLAMLTVPSIVLPTETKVATTTKKTTPKRCAKGKKLSHGRCIKAKAKKTKKAKKSSTKEM